MDDSLVAFNRVEVDKGEKVVIGYEYEWLIWIECGSVMAVMMQSEDEGGVSNMLALVIGSCMW